MAMDYGNGLSENGKRNKASDSRTLDVELGKHGPTEQKFIQNGHNSQRGDNSRKGMKDY